MRERHAIEGRAVLAVILAATLFFRRDPLLEEEMELGSVHAWLVADDPDSLKAFGEMTAGFAEPVVNVHVQKRYPEGKGEPPLPRWPSPRPVVFVASSAGCVFFHPLCDV